VEEKGKFHGMECVIHASGHWPHVFADKKIKKLPYSPKKIQSHITYLKKQTRRKKF
jgi:hypothetical protein